MVFPGLTRLKQYDRPALSELNVSVYDDDEPGTPMGFLHGEINEYEALRQDADTVSECPYKAGYDDLIPTLKQSVVDNPLLLP